MRRKLLLITTNPLFTPFSFFHSQKGNYSIDVLCVRAGNPVPLLVIFSNFFILMSLHIMRAAVYCPWPNSVSHTFTCRRTDMKRPQPLCRHTDAMNLRENTEENTNYPILSLLPVLFSYSFNHMLFPSTFPHFITIIIAIFSLCQLW